MDIRELLKNMSAEDKASIAKEAIKEAACFTPPIENAPYINVIFCKGHDGWMPFTGYGCDLDTKAAVEFIEQINKAADVLNKKGDEE